MERPDLVEQLVDLVHLDHLDHLVPADLEEDQDQLAKQEGLDHRDLWGHVEILAPLALQVKLVDLDQLDHLDPVDPQGPLDLQEN